MPWVSTDLDDRDTVTPEEADRYRQNVQPEYERLFKTITQGLPLDRIYGLGPHSMPAIEEAVAIVQPRRILEIGFGGGASAAMFLEFAPKADLISFDNAVDPRIQQASHHLEKTYPGRFLLRPEPSAHVAWLDFGPDMFDLAFIDGDHSLIGVSMDIRSVLHRGIPYLLLDDWWPHFGDVQLAAKHVGLMRKIKQWGNLILFRADA